MSAALDLVVLNGALEGEVVQLRPNQPLKIGRASRGFQLTDPLVSLNHAEITWEGDRYWIEDIQSATGTFVNDVRLSEKAVVLVPGMRIRLGETDIEVRERPRSAMLRIVGFAAAVFILILGVRSFRASIEVEYTPEVLWFDPISQGAGFQSSTLRIPEEFIRQNGVDHRDLVIDKVTDYDANGVDELWIHWAKGRQIVTFAADGGWRKLADIDSSCREKSRSLAKGLPAECYVDRTRVQSELPAICEQFQQQTGFPDLDCSGSTYRYGEEGYAIVEHEGLYAWMPPTEQVDDGKPKKKRKKGPPPVPKRKVIDGPPEPFLFTLIRPSNLAGFLADRGVVEPIHYLICEEAIPGIRAQVLTQRGEIVTLAMGCIGDLMVEGPTRLADFGDGLPRMFAFTGNGYEALKEDLAAYMAGGSDLLFMSAADRELFNAVIAPPARRVGAIRVAFEGPDRIFDPVAAEEPVTTQRTLVASEFGYEVPPKVSTIVIDGPGLYDLDGCAELDVKINDWHCLRAKGCGAGSAFARIHNVGCGDAQPVDVPYKRGILAYNDPVIEGRVAVESLELNGQIDVLRLRFSYRER